jgi:Tfp pilus assembly protein PilX
MRPVLPLLGDAIPARATFTAAGSPIEERGVPKLICGGIRRLLGDERGFALPMALGVTVVLSSLAAGIFTYVVTNQGASERARADQRAYGLAEAGLSYAFSTLGNASNPYDATAVPSTTVTLSGGTATYSGTLSGVTWTLTGTGTVKNPSGPSAADVVRSVSAQAIVTTTSVPDMRPWNYLFVDQPSDCVTLGNSVSADVSLYVRGNLCLQNTAQIDSPAVHVLGSLYVTNNAQIGSSADPVGEFQRTGSCYLEGTLTTCGPASRVWADTIGTTPPTIPKPTVDLPYWYANADLGPLASCTTLTGSGFPGFDNDAIRNVSLGTIDLTPSTAYSCKRVVLGQTVGEITWVPGSGGTNPGTLTIKGVIYFDAHLRWENLNTIQYDGLAVIYASGTVTIENNTDICGVEACDETWDPRVDLLVLVVGSMLDATQTSPNSVVIGNFVSFQGAIYAVNDYSQGNNTNVWGPVITRNTDIVNSSLLHAPPYPIEYMNGMPSASTTTTQVAPVQGSYAG